MDIELSLQHSSSNITWSSQLETVEVESFEQHVGPQVLVPCSSVGTFFLFFTRTLLEYIVLQSNKYAFECMGGEKYESWEKITVDELTAFMGFMLLMGVVRLPSTHDYWKRDEVCHYAPVARRISRNRFFEIQRYLHFTDNSTLAAPGTPEYNKLEKIQPIIDSLLENFQTAYNLHRDVSVDEAMVPFKGRSTLKQYMPMKPVKRGFKVWMLADAHTGYVSGFEIYTGKKGDTVEKGLGASVVKTLCQPIQHRYSYYLANKLTLDVFDIVFFPTGTITCTLITFFPA